MTVSDDSGSHTGFEVSKHSMKLGPRVNSGAAIFLKPFRNRQSVAFGIKGKEPVLPCHRGIF